MKKLSSNQKKMIREAVHSYWKKFKQYPLEPLDLENYKEIEDINPFESFYNYADMYMWDLRFSEEFNNYFISYNQY